MGKFAAGRKIILSCRCCDQSFFSVALTTAQKREHQTDLRRTEKRNWLNTKTQPPPRTSYKRTGLNACRQRLAYRWRVVLLLVLQQTFYLSSPYSRTLFLSGSMAITFCALPCYRRSQSQGWLPRENMVPLLKFSVQQSVLALLLFLQNRGQDSRRQLI